MRKGTEGVDMSSFFRFATTRCRRLLSSALPSLLVLSGCRGKIAATPIVITQPPTAMPSATATRRSLTATPTATPTPRTAPTPTLVPSPSPLPPAPTPTAVSTTPAVPEEEVEPPAAMATSAPPVEQVVSWQDAGQHIGQEATVEGAIILAENKGSVIYLNFSHDYRHDFKIVIFPDDAAKFPGPPAEIYDGHTLRVKGEIIEYEGAPEIIVREPAQIEVIGAEAELLSTATPAPPVQGIVDWRDAAQYYGQQVAVEGMIVRTKNTGKVTFLNFDPDYRHTLTLVIFSDDAAKFPVPPDEMFLQRRVRATGVVEEYKGAPEIIISEPEQIEIVEDR